MFINWVRVQFIVVLAASDASGCESTSFSLVKVKVDLILGLALLVRG